MHKNHISILAALVRPKFKPLILFFCQSHSCCLSYFAQNAPKRSIPILHHLIPSTNPIFIDVNHQSSYSISLALLVQTCHHMCRKIPSLSFDLHECSLLAFDLETCSLSEVNSSFQDLMGTNISSELHSKLFFFFETTICIGT